MKSAIQILTTELTKLGADGLCNPDMECGCGYSDLNEGNCLCEDCYPAIWITPRADDKFYRDEWPDGYFLKMEEAKG